MATAPATGATGPADQAAPPPIAVFMKHLQPLGAAEIARRIASQPVAGIEATLRKGGLIEPHRLAEELPRLCELLARYDRQIVIAASDVTKVDAQTERYLQLLAQHQIRYFRMGYYRYDLTRPLLPQLDQFARQARQVADLAVSLGLIGLYQNHAGPQYAGAALWDLLHIFRGIPVDHLAVAVDIRHAAVELSLSYPAALAAIEPHRGGLYVKDSRWTNNRPENVPLGQGIAKPVFDLVRRTGLRGPISLHMEYTDHRDPQQVEASWQAICNDIATLQQWLNG
ncbi:MAG: hypothetical protein KatS3mg111_1640 [Pirellulaceae bacterium]|nr:MAG: hypothetical protein KatS3mg111_1640 [Pirellulaceae bacterium]